MFTTETVILMIFAAAFMLFSFAIIVFAVMSYRIAALYAPPGEDRRRIPGLGQRLRRHLKLESADTEAEQPATEGKNAWPDRDEEVAARPAVTQFVGAAEASQAKDREQWWEEKRGEGFTEDQIGEMEDARIVPVFEAES